MSQPYVGEIKQFAGNFAPNGWMFCQGQFLPISENEVLFNLIGTTYGGDGQETFALPNLAARVPVHMGTGSSGTTYQLGETGGVESVTLNVNQIPAHTHQFVVNSASNSDKPGGNVFANSLAAKPFAAGPMAGTEPFMKANNIGVTGSSQPHDNMIPFLGVNYIISLFGVYPSQT